RGGEDERFDPGGLDGGEDVRQRTDVLPVVHDRLLDGLADLLLRGEVDDRVDRVLLDGGGQAVLGIGGRQIEIDDVQSVDSGCQAGREVVDDENVIPALGQQPHHMRTDISCAAG